MTNVLLAAAAPHAPLRAFPTPSISLEQAAVIVNPSKFSARHLDRFTSEVDAAFVSLGWLAPLWLHTTAATKGAVEARTALSAGVDVVFVAGGDGTVRTVAQELAGTGTPVALLPMGTGNLLARNLGIPRGDLTAAVQLACTGTDLAIDVGWLELDERGDRRESERFAFLVMAGAGFDAATMAGANHTMKTRLGPAAYLVSGVRASQEEMATITITIDGETRTAQTSRGVIVGNVGTLTMGMALMPDADPTDGRLDGVVFYQRTLLDWARVALSVMTRSRRGTRHMPRLHGREIEVLTDSPQPVEVDGDVIGQARRVRFSVQPGALLVRCL
jgi:diacylglycerol kinase (ATP)